MNLKTVYKMQLNKADNIIKQLKDLDTENFPQGLQCWIKEEGTYNIHVFSILVDNEDQLKAIQANVRDYIAIYFQGQILKDEVERWNIYQVFFCKEPIKENVLKMSIEQDKFATRKLIFDEGIAENISEETMSTMIFNEIFKFEFKPTVKELPPLSESLSEEVSKIVELTAALDSKDDDALSNFVTSICNE